jgi:hypothetical protein
MTARPILDESRRRTFIAAVSLVLVMVAVLLAAGCTDGKNVQERDNEKVRILVTSTIATTAASTDIGVIDNYSITTNRVSPLTVTTKIDGAYTIVRFVGAGTTTWTPPSGVSSVEYLVVAGGGGGNGGGGGAGGVVAGSNFPVSGNISVIVGAGGTGNYKTSGVLATNGANSVFSTITALGGGKGAQGNNYVASAGGSGGGAAGSNAGTNTMTPGAATQPASTSGGYGNAGGSGIYIAGFANGGGGGAGAAGGPGTSSSHGAGGIGIPSSITGTPTYYGGGGGGGGERIYAQTAGTGGLGGGGAGTIESSGVDGTAGTGGGGGGSVRWGGQSSGGNGGSGVVIIRYLTPGVSRSDNISYVTPVVTRSVD